MRTRMRFAAGLLAGALLGGGIATEAQGQSNECPRVTAVEETGGNVATVDPAPGPVSAAGSARTARALPGGDEKLEICLSRSSIDAADYHYPYHDPYLATITAAIVNVDGHTPGLRRQVVHVPVLPDRNQLPSLEGRGLLSIALYRQDHPAPLLFIVSGIGSNPYFGLATHLAGLFYRQGSHVVILPSPMSWNFALAASRSGAPGYTPEDSRDLYEAMQQTLRVLNTRYDVRITGVNFLGASLGALEGAYLSVLDAEEGKIGISKYLLLNPPLDLAYALKAFDEWGALRDRFGRTRSDRIRAEALAIVEPDPKANRDGPAAVATVARTFARFTTEELQFLIAEYVRSVLPELVYVTQVIHDQHILTAPIDQPRKRLQEAKTFTLKDYTDKIAVPLWRREAAEPGVDSTSLSQRGSLAPILDQLRGNSKVHIMHNADDVLVDRRAVEELKGVMGEQMMLYPHGGHLGNLWYWENTEYMVSLFRRPPELDTSPPPADRTTAGVLRGPRSR